MGDFKYVSLLCWLFSLRCCGYEPRARGILIKGLAPVLNSLLLERPAFISLAQQTTDTHRRLWVRTRLQSYTQVYSWRVCVCVFLGLVRKKGCWGGKKRGSRRGSFHLWKLQLCEESPDWKHFTVILSVQQTSLLMAGFPAAVLDSPHRLSGRDRPHFSH